MPIPVRRKAARQAEVMIAVMIGVIIEVPYRVVIQHLAAENAVDSGAARAVRNPRDRIQIARAAIRRRLRANLTLK